MTLLVHLLQYQLPLSEMTDTDKNNDLITITDLIINASVVYCNSIVVFTTEWTNI